MPTNTLPKISINNPASDFSAHLISNSRILFSGAFGIGKTFFLKHFFGDPAITEKYNVIHLFPVNYQIAANEDIFELIKYDILCHLLDLHLVNIDNNKRFSKSLAYQSYFMNNSVNIVSKVLQCVPVLKDIGKAIETLDGIRKDAVNYEKEINTNETTLLKEFFTGLDQKRGSIYEFDAISEFIYNCLTNRNDESDETKHKKNVLIIDDLDRVDPEHVFRLLNVFSAHIDREEGTNKFGFDKIIFVCDIENIRNIFAAKYGQHTDFTGYIDKFYDSEVFHFNNKVAILEFIKKIMDDNYYKFRNQPKDSFIDDIMYIRDILYLFVERSGINLRQIFANVEDLKNTKPKIGILSRYTYSAGHTLIQTCLRIVGGRKDNLINAFKKATLPLETEFNQIDCERIASLILPLSIEDIYNGFKETEFCFHKDDIKIPFTLKKNTLTYNYRLEEIYAVLPPPNSISYPSISQNELQAIFIEAVNILDKKGLLN